MKTFRTLSVALLSLAASAAPAAARTITVTIRFIAPSTPGVQAACEAVTSTPVLKANTGDRITWKIVKDEDNPCGALDADKVILQFTRPGIVDDDNASTKDQYVRGHHHTLSADRAEGTVVAAAGKYKYQVMFDGKIAQDPELDVSGQLPPAR